MNLIYLVDRDPATDSVTTCISSRDIHMSGIYIHIQISVGSSFLFSFFFFEKIIIMDNHRHFFCVFDKMSVGAKLS